VESARPDRLFDDPYAAVLAGEDGQFSLRAFGPQGLLIVTYLGLRTWFLDDVIVQGWQAGIRQCVILAAGMDTRAYRLPWPEGMRVFELDRPAVLAVKDAILAGGDAEPRSDRQVIGVDLTGPWVPALRQAGFDPEKPAIWLIEGLLMYLDAPDVQALLTAIGDLAAPGSRLGADIPNPPAARGHLLAAATEQERQLAQRFGTDDPEGLFGDHGWQVTVQSPDQVAARVNRPPLPPLVMPDGHVVRNWLVSGTR
jgi:methyltransferase (TIGR00027 family)